MAWNEPGNNGKDRNPWNNNKKDQSPPDLDDLFKDILKKINNVMGKNNRNGKGFNFSGLGLIAVILGVVWFISGFYTIREAEKGVVLRFGQYYETVEPGLSWKATFIDTVYPVDLESVRSLQASGFMLTKDENLVRVQLDVQYQVSDPRAYLFNVANPDDSLGQATDSALRSVVGQTIMDDVLTTGRERVRDETRRLLEDTIAPYQLGLRLVEVNLLPARPPEEVKHAFDDATAAREDEQQFIRRAEAYALAKLPEARARAKTLTDAAEAQREKAVLQAQGEVARFEALLPQYTAAPDLTRQRLYIEMMEDVYKHTGKIIVDTPEGGQNLLYLPIDKLLSNTPTLPRGPVLPHNSSDNSHGSGSTNHKDTSMNSTQNNSPLRQVERFTSRGGR